MQAESKRIFTKMDKQVEGVKEKIRAENREIVEHEKEEIKETKEHLSDIEIEIAKNLYKKALKDLDKNKSKATIIPKKLLNKNRCEDNTLINIIKAYWVESKRHLLNLHLSAFLRKRGYTLEHAEKIIRSICKERNDEEEETRIKSLINTYKEPETKYLKGITGLKEMLSEEEIQEIQPYETQPITEEYKVEDGLNVFQENKDLLAEQFYKIQPYFYDKAGLWWVWNFKHKKYDMIDEYDLMNKIREYTAQPGFQSSTNKFWSETIRALKIIGRSKIPMETPKTWIQFKNKIIDYKTQEIHEPNHNYFTTNTIPWILGENKETPNIDIILTEWVGEKNILKLKEVMAYCMIQDYPIHRIMCLTGSGLNGKGEYLRLIQKVIGKQNVCSTELDLLMVSRFETAKLYKKLVCQMGETNFSEISRTSMLKKLTGQDLIGYEFKNKNPFDDTNYAKLIISTNSLPPTTDKTDGFYRRWMIIDFPNKFKEGTSVLDRIPEAEYNGFCLQSLNILKNLLEKGCFDQEGDISNRRKRYEEKSNPLNEFVNETYKKNVNGKVPLFEFEESYNFYLGERGLRKINRRHLSKMLRDDGFDVQRDNVQRNDGSWTKWSFIFGLDTIDTLDSDTMLLPTTGSKRGVVSNVSKVSKYEQLIDKTLMPCSICGNSGPDNPCVWKFIKSNDLLCDDCKHAEEVQR